VPLCRGGAPAYPRGKARSHSRRSLTGLEHLPLAPRIGAEVRLGIAINGNLCVYAHLAKPIHVGALLSISALLRGTTFH
jgi:hypothetical protein